MLHPVGGRASGLPSPADRRESASSRAGMWGLPTKNTLDRATAMLPELMYERLDELGIDFAVLYPTYGLTVTALAERRAAPRPGPGVEPLLRRGLRRLP